MVLVKQEHLVKVEGSRNKGLKKAIIPYTADNVEHVPNSYIRPPPNVLKQNRFIKAAAETKWNH